MWIKDDNDEVFYNLDSAVDLEATSTGNVVLHPANTTGGKILRSFATQAEAVEWIENLLNVKEN